MTPKYSIRAFNGKGDIIESASTGSFKMAKKIARRFISDYGQAVLWEYKGMRDGVALYELVTL